MLLKCDQLLTAVTAATSLICDIVFATELWNLRSKKNPLYSIPTRALHSRWIARFSPNEWARWQLTRTYFSLQLIWREWTLLGSVISNPASTVGDPGTIEQHFHNRKTLAPCLKNFRRSRNCGRCSHLQIWWRWSAQSRNQEHFHNPSVLLSLQICCLASGKMSKCWWSPDKFWICWWCPGSFVWC